jgi:chemotaxis receptor (MCP) glutamine deamidase CheD
MKHLQGKQCAGAVTKVGVHQGDDYFEYDYQAMVERLIGSCIGMESFDHSQQFGHCQR